MFSGAEPSRTALPKGPTSPEPVGLGVRGRIPSTEEDASALVKGILTSRQA